MTTRRSRMLVFALSFLVLGTFSPGPADAAQEDVPAPQQPMALIPAGSFLMGDTFGEGKPYELPVHEVVVNAFYMDRHEVMKALWDKVATWAVGRGYDLRPGDGAGQGPDHPVSHVSWHEAVKWANARSEMEGLTPCYRVEGNVYRQGEAEPRCIWTASGYRLPTEAEWEKAARGGEHGLRYPWGDDISCAQANALGCVGTTTPVGSYDPNGYGLYDTVGNVSEWCWDWMHGSYYASSPRDNPTGPSLGNLRVCRGGDKGAAADWSRISLRTYNHPHHESGALGFRLVRSAP